MSKSINQSMVMGNLTAAPEVKVLPSGTKASKFSLALNRSYQDANKEWQETTTFLDIVTYGKLAEQIEERLDKGSRVLVEGRIESRTWEKDGTKHTKYEIVATDVTFLDQAKRIDITEE